MTNDPSKTNWLLVNEQQFWFDKFQLDGCISFKQFQKFLYASIYHHSAQLDVNKLDDIAVDNCQTTEPDDSCRAVYSENQEQQIFEIFDSNQDSSLDFGEFKVLCEHWLEKVFHSRRALIIVDVQNDFINGSLALINGPARQDGVDVVPIINKLVGEHMFDLIIYTQDWHPPDHIGFYENLHLRKYKLMPSEAVKQNAASNRVDSNHHTNGNDSDGSRQLKLKKLVKEVKPFESVIFDEGKTEQILWPTHCIQNSWGAELHPELLVQADALYIHKGTLSNVDAYSAFWDNKRLNKTGLEQALKMRNIDDVYICGLALDYCVAATALDSNRSGFVTFLLEDACRGLDELEIEKKRQELSDSGVIILRCNQLKYSTVNMFARTTLRRATLSSKNKND